MTNRMVIFQGQTNWLMAPVFIGDKTELAQESATRSCDKNWGVIARHFLQVKTKDEFVEASAWAHGQYHDTAGGQTAKKVKIFKRPDEMPDEVLVVHEDLGVSGIHAIGVCPTCGRTHFMHYRPDKTAFSTGNRCLTCAAILHIQGQLPSQKAWEEALDKYNKPAPSFRMAVPADFPQISQQVQEYASKREKPPTDEEFAAAERGFLAEMLKDDIAARHMGEPLKISKIVRFSGNAFFYEVIFLDWSSTVLHGQYLIPLEK